MTELRDHIQSLSPKRLALLALELDAKLKTIQSQVSAPIAVVGLGCRVPGAAPGPDGFWDLLQQGKDGVGLVPAERWDIDRFYDPDPDAPARISTRWGGFLDGPASAFDAGFFGISRREAVTMDPQHRLLLEVAWEALEHSGIDPQTLSGSRTGVYIGVSTIDYHQMTLARGQHAIDAYTASGSAHSIAAARISYFLNLRGPNLAIDTSCSSSLVAVHQACQSLRADECTIAIAGGVNMLLSPEISMALSRAHMMAADGHCKAFDERADGFVRGEGCGIVVLKRLRDALVDGDNILALLRGSAVNQDGRSNGITAPNGAAQEAVIRAALANANLAPGDIDFVETHGTGTALGDPTEAHALAAVFAAARSQPLVIGSVKANIGHLEAAAGVAGLIKVVLALKHGVIPPQLHFERLNPHIDWAAASIEVAARGTPWPHDARARRAGVSSFGFSGTNVHVVVEEAPAAAVRSATPRSVQILPLAARSEWALSQLEGRYSESLPLLESEAADICFTAAVGRAHFPVRAAYVAVSAEALLGKLRERAATARGRSDAPTEVAFLFTGQGAQYAGMGRELYDSEPVFRRVIDECNAFDLLYGHDADVQLDDTRFAQPALFALQCALAALWRSWGVEPRAVLGHSVGEYAAACVAGAYSLADGMRLITTRGRLTGGSNVDSGAMAAVLSPAKLVRAAVEPFSKWLAIAAENGPESVVISGRVAEVQTVSDAFAQQGCRVERLRVSHAFHSPLMESAAVALAEVAGSVAFHEPSVSLISTVTGGPVTRTELSRTDYWRRQVRDGVQFQSAMEAASSFKIFIEIGPGSTLLGLGRALLPDDECMWAPSIRRKRRDSEQMTESLAALYARGAAVDWVSYHAGRGRRRVPAPTYPFERQQFWLDPPSESSGATSLNRKNSPVPAVPPPTESSTPQDWFYRLEWHECPVCSASAGATATDPAALAHIRRETERLVKTHEFARYDDLVPRLDRVCAFYAREALAAVPNPATPRFERLYPRLRAMTVNSHDLGPVDADAECALLASEFPQYRGAIELLRLCGSQLSSILRGELDPVAVLGGALDVLDQIYRESSGAKVLNGTARAALELVLDSSAADRTIKVLEIGAGTGGTTAELASILSGRAAEYLFTDVSPLFLLKAKERFGNYSFFRYASLDIEHEPTIAGGYDVVVAANVLHATIDLRAALTHVRSLMAPGGLLLLIEGTRPEGWVDLTFGLTDGWWRFRDCELRDDYPLLSQERWLALLESEGFRASAIRPGSTSQQVLFLARAPVRSAPCVFAGATDSELARAFLAKVPTGTVVSSAGELERMIVPDADIVLDATSGDCFLPPFLRAVSSSPVSARVRLLTRGAHALSVELASPEQAVQWGLARVAALEHPRLWAGAIDFHPDAPPSEIVEAVLNELSSGSNEDQVAFRTGRRYVPRLVREKKALQPTPIFRADGSYVIIGGLGELGRKTAEWLVGHGARHLVLVGRTALADSAAVAALERLGASVKVLAVDIAADDAIVALHSATSGAPVRGIVHAAAVFDNTPVVELTQATLNAVLRPKLTGALRLVEFSVDASLDFLVFFSSTIGTFGARGMGAYAAANGALDAVGQLARHRGIPAVSINWGSWDIMRGTSDQDRQSFVRKGLPPMPSQMALAALGAVMSEPRDQVVIANIEWSALKAVYEAWRPQPIFELVSSVVASPDARPASTPAPTQDMAILLADVPAAERLDYVMAAVSKVVATVLAMQPEELDPATGLFEMGMDSLMSVEVKRRLEALTARKLPATLTFNHPNVRALGVFLLNALGLAPQVEATVPAAVPSKVQSAADGRESLSEGELAGLLADALKSVV